MKKKYEPKKRYSYSSIKRLGCEAGGYDNSLSTHRTKATAEKAGAEVARSDRLERVIRGRDGRIQDSDSYRNDPNPPKDRRD